MIINGLQKFTISRSVLSYLRSIYGVDFDASIDAIVALAKQNKMMFNSKNLVLSKVLHQQKKRL